MTSMYFLLNFFLSTDLFFKLKTYRELARIIQWISIHPNIDSPNVNVFHIFCHYFLTVSYRSHKTLSLNTLAYVSWEQRLSYITGFNQKSHNIFSCNIFLVSFYLFREQLSFFFFFTLYDIFGDSGPISSQKIALLFLHVWNQLNC